MLEHAGIDVGQYHQARAADLARQSRRQIAGAAGDIECTAAGFQSGQRQRELLPEPMSAARHQIVHEVVAVGDAVEYAPDTARLVLERNVLKTKVGGFAAIAGHPRPLLDLIGILLCSLRL